MIDVKIHRRTVSAALLTAAAILLLAGAGFLLVVYSGEYNVAASKPHYGAVEWALETTMKHSVRDHAKGIDAPPLTDTTLLRSGFEHFESMCVTCHGAPGVGRSEIGEGLLPRPPELSEEVPEWTPAELFWIVEHGIKMSGMPAFGETHDDRTLWGIVGVLRMLPETDSAAYAGLQQRWGGGGGGGHGHGGGGGAARADTASGDGHDHGH